MKKIISLILGIVIIMGVATGCANNTTSKKDEKKLKIVTTIFPVYDWTKSILGEKFDDTDITMLLDNGVDLHSYQPTADDMVAISDCDVFIYVGGESDGWVEDALEQATNPDIVAIDILEVLGDTVKPEQLVEGMQESEHHHHGDEDEHEHEDEHHHEDEHEHEDEHHHEDEHVWLSLKNAKLISQRIAEELSNIDSQNADIYTSNVNFYIKDLNELDTQYEQTLASANKHTLLFGDRFPFRYLVDDYNLDYFAAFSGCSAETEASFQTIVFLADKMDELNLSTILTIEGAKHKIAETIASNTKNENDKILTLDSMQSTSWEDVENGTTYLAVMKDNLKILKEALQ